MPQSADRATSSTSCSFLRVVCPSLQLRRERSGPASLPRTNGSPNHVAHRTARDASFNQRAGLSSLEFADAPQAGLGGDAGYIQA
jgi:hypothetical protein